MSIFKNFIKRLIIKSNFNFKDTNIDLYSFFFQLATIMLLFLVKRSQIWVLVLTYMILDTTNGINKYTISKKRKIVYTFVDILMDIIFVSLCIYLILPEMIRYFTLLVIFLIEIENGFSIIEFGEPIGLSFDYFDIILLYSLLSSTIKLPHEIFIISLAILLSINIANILNKTKKIS